MRKAFAGILAGIIALFAFNGSADAVPTVGKRPAVQSICETGYRGMPEYDRKCLTRGTMADGRRMWFTGGGTSKGDRAMSVKARKAQCRDARDTGNMRAGIRDMFTDVAYDHFRNYRTVLTWTAAFGMTDCKRLGIK